MPVDKGTAWTIYLLMAKHSETDDGKSELRRAVESAITSGTAPKDALVSAVKAQLNNTDVSGTLGPLPDLEPGSLRTALQLTYTGGAGCPDVGQQEGILAVMANNI